MLSEPSANGATSRRSRGAVPEAATDKPARQPAAVTRRRPPPLVRLPRSCAPKSGVSSATRKTTNDRQGVGNSADQTSRGKTYGTTSNDTDRTIIKETDQTNESKTSFQTTRKAIADQTDDVRANCHTKNLVGIGDGTPEARETKTDGATPRVTFAESWTKFLPDEGPYGESTSGDVEGTLFVDVPADVGDKKTAKRTSGSKRGVSSAAVRRDNNGIVRPILPRPVSASSGASALKVVHDGASETKVVPVSIVTRGCVPEDLLASTAGDFLRTIREVNLPARRVLCCDTSSQTALLSLAAGSAHVLVDDRDDHLYPTIIPTKYKTPATVSLTTKYHDAQHPVASTPRLSPPLPLLSTTHIMLGDTALSLYDRGGRAMVEIPSQMLADRGLFDEDADDRDASLATTDVEGQYVVEVPRRLLDSLAENRRDNGSMPDPDECLPASECAREPSSLLLKLLTVGGGGDVSGGETGGSKASLSLSSSVVVVHPFSGEPAAKKRRTRLAQDDAPLDGAATEVKKTAPGQGDSPVELPECAPSSPKTEKMPVNGEAPGELPTSGAPNSKAARSAKRRKLERMFRDLARVVPPPMAREGGGRPRKLTRRMVEAAEGGLPAATGVSRKEKAEGSGGCGGTQAKPAQCLRPVPMDRLVKLPPQAMEPTGARPAAPGTPSRVKAPPVARRKKKGTEAASPAMATPGKASKRSPVSNGALVETHQRGVSICQVNDQMLKTAFEDWKDCIKRDAITGNIPLHEAVLDDDLAAVRTQCALLRARRMSLDVLNNDRETPLHLAIKLRLVDAMRELRLRGARLDVTDDVGNTALHLAVIHCVPGGLATLMEAGRVGERVPLEALNDEGYAPLHLSALYNSIADTESLLSFNADVDQKDAKSGRTPLFMAVEHNLKDIVRVLLRAGASTTEPNYSGQTPITAANELGDNLLLS